MAEEAEVRVVRQHLWSVPETSVFAVFDGASVKGLREKLWEKEPQHVCLWRGELAPDMAEVAPYLIELEPDAEFTQWVLEKGWGNHWGIFVATGEPLRSLRQHFRRLTMVRDPDGKSLYFRFYDPRVLRIFLPTCTPDELRDFFGPVACFVVEAEDSGTLLRFSRRDAALRREEVKLPK